MTASDRPTTARQSRLVPVCATWWALTCAFAPFSACLNPMPEEFPSERGTEEAPADYSAAPGDGAAGAAATPVPEQTDADGPSDPVVGEGPGATPPPGPDPVAPPAPPADAPDAGACSDADAAAPTIDSVADSLP